MATIKRRARTAPVNTSRTLDAGRHPGRARAHSTWLAPLLGLGTVAVLLLIVFAAVNRAGSVSTASLPAASGGTANPSIPDYGGVTPAFGIGVLDNRSGLASPGPVPKVGSLAPDFAWDTVNGPQHLTSLRGHPVLLEFFAPWCPQCQRETPMMNSFAASPLFKGLQVLAVSASPYGKDYETRGSEVPISMVDMTWYKSTYGTVYPLIFDPHTRVFNLYGYGSGYPTFWVIDASGRVRFDTSRYITPAALVAQVRKVLPG